MLICNMTIDEVIANIDNTIRGKMMFVRDLGFGNPLEEVVLINIGELTRIRADLIKVKESAQKA